jgi:hypothetical protein
MRDAQAAAELNRRCRRARDFCPSAPMSYRQGNLNWSARVISGQCNFGVVPFPPPFTCLYLSTNVCRNIRVVYQVVLDKMALLEVEEVGVAYLQVWFL